jgi:N utilization substance protein A
MEVIVNDDYLSIAIGKGGQNVSLACEITGWHLEVTSEEEYSREVKQGYESLMKLTGVGLSMAETLFKAGYASLVDISETGVEDLVSITSLDEIQVEAMIQEAKDILGKEAEAPEDTDTEDVEEVEDPAEQTEQIQEPDEQEEQKSEPKDDEDN